jgi:hypothetical protein
MRPRLILHAGTHKTGTTSIQKVLADNRASLRAQGLIYPDGGTAFGKTKIPHHRFSHALASADPDDKRKALTFLAEARHLARAGDTILISAEPIYRHVYGSDRWRELDTQDYWTGRQRYLDTVADVLSDFAVEVILFFRERESFAKSVHFELTKKGDWSGDIASFRIAHAPLFEYERQLELFRNAFPHVRVLNYEDACRAGLVKTFFETIGFPMPAGADSVWERASS